MGRRSLLITGSVLGVVIFIAACSHVLPVAPAGDAVLDGPVDDLTGEQLARHATGDAAFTDQVFTPQTGLGPVFVATSCGSCHKGDGKGTPFTTLTRFGQTDSTGNHFLEQGGPQLQSRAIPGYQPEQIPEGASFAKFTPPINTGLGFLELVSDADIIAMAAGNTNNADGVRGHPNWNYIPAYIPAEQNRITRGGKYICRFGKKASVFNLLQQTVNAYNQDIGITSSFDPLDAYTRKVIDPEIGTSTINDVVFYLQTLKAPLERTPNDVAVQQGKAIFIQAGCENCHKQTLKTGYSPVDVLSNKEFHPYTDLLVHDMGPGLDDGYTEGNAKTSEWRTAPLWGLGLAKNSQGGNIFLLHDGRAHSISEAILMHGGEAAVSKGRFNKLTVAEQEKVIKFLQSL
ncbi:CxxC motif-containing protein, DUF1111 family [Mucilaginibacter pineti]|uniref:CxxC motif-containing protein, DUF1111 family n=1 Tax=Mucilaginibacter pineti TaxID=1391627 RepID=A0A1G6ST19_9SPHI|nr:di-heme oxidoredictase family protein [Mucilaginibacter pineti]SDD20090.1 CxxC motif-containing protein, DUF1111 family [Mucilaginibacter pineti]